MSVIISVILIVAGYFYRRESSLLSVWNILTSTSEVGSITTAEYIEQFDPHRYELAGADYFNPRYSLSRLNKTIDQIDITYDYPFDYLDRVAARLANVDRRQALKAIFEKVTNGATTNLERHLAVLKFLQKSSFHNQVQPMYRDGQAVFDPLILLEVGEMRCGAVARLGVDLFEAAGYNGRLVQAHAHTSAEIYYDGSWHLFEGDLSGGTPVIIDGAIPSLEKLSATPYVMDTVPAFFELTVGTKNVISPGIYRSYFFFSKDDLSKLDASYYYKTATNKQAASSKWYGWDYYRAENDRWQLASMKPMYEPPPVVFKSVKKKRGKATVTWNKVLDYDDDALGYRVYVSSKSRGWNYRNIDLTDSVSPHVLDDWNPDMYDAMFKLPPHDLGLFKITDTDITLKTAEDQTIYVTVMAFDEYGEMVGRQLYNMSPELAITGQ